jgi:membrane fusion protein, adhesin transport system
MENIGNENRKDTASSNTNTSELDKDKTDKKETPATLTTPTSIIQKPKPIPISKVALEQMRLLSNEDGDFISDSKAALLTRSAPLIGTSLYLFAGFIVLIIIWLSISQIDEVTSGMGKVVPFSQVQIIQNLEGGILKQILVKEGDVVKQGQILVKLDDTYFASSYREKYAQYLTLQTTAARLMAEEKNADTINFPPEVVTNSTLVSQETALFTSRQKSLKENVANLKRSYKLAIDELNITEPLVAHKVISRIELLRLQRDIVSIKTRLDAYENDYQQQVLTDLTKTQANIAALQEDLTALKDRMERTTMRSPVNGIIKQIYLTTVGGILRPAVPIMEVVPINDNLIIEARISPTDIGFIKIGQKAQIKITAYDYSIYGSLDAVVTNISADTTVDEARSISYYEVDLKTDKNYLNSKDGPLKIAPGMLASVDILTGKKTLMTYLLKPIFRAQGKALRER